MKLNFFNYIHLFKTKKPIKMKKILGVLVVVLALSSCSQKTGYVDNGKVINEIKEKVALEAKYTALSDDMKKSTDSIAKLFQAKYEKLNTLSGSKKKKELELFNQKAQRYQQQMQAQQQAFQQNYQSEIDSLITKVKTYITTYGSSNGYDFIYGTVEASPTIMYAKDDKNLSQSIIDGLDAAFKE